MPRKMRRQALRCALSALAGEDRLVVVDALSVETPKAKAMAEIVQSLVGDGNSALFLMPERDENVELSTRNLKQVQTLHATYLNIRDLLTYDKVIMPLDALEIISAWLG
jgi:large subunit ribosomal protein L4